MGPIVGLGFVTERIGGLGFVAGRPMRLEIGQRGRKKQVPRCARNDNLRTVRRAVGVAVGVIGPV